MLMQNTSWRTNAYTWCTNGCLAVVSVTSYDNYDTAVNGDFHQVTTIHSFRLGTLPTHILLQPCHFFFFFGSLFFPFFLGGKWVMS